MLALASLRAERLAEAAPRLPPLAQLLPQLLPLLLLQEAARNWHESTRLLCSCRLGLRSWQPLKRASWEMCLELLFFPCTGFETFTLMVLTALDCFAETCPHCLLLWPRFGARDLQP